MPKLGYAATVISAVLLGVLSPGALRAAPLTLSVPGPGSGPGNDPLLDVNSWFLFSDQTAPVVTTITLTSGDFAPPGTGKFAGFVQVTAECCFDTKAGKNVALEVNLALTATTPGAVVGTPGPSFPLPSVVARELCLAEKGKAPVCPPRSRVSQKVILTAGETVNFNLSALPTKAVTPGRYLVTITAASVGTSPQVLADNAFPILNVMPALPVDDAEMPASCPSPPQSDLDFKTEAGPGSPVPTTEVLLLRPLIRELFTLKAAFPIAGVVNTTIGTVANTAAWRISVMAPPTPLASNLTLITLNNEAGWDKIMVAFNSTVCPHSVPPPTTVPTGISGVSMVVDLNTAKSLLLRRQACNSWFGVICTDTSRFDDIAIFSETNFAFLFGGRAVTLDWFFSQGE
jgi:hypothetical protein